MLNELLKEQFAPMDSVQIFSLILRHMNQLGGNQNETLPLEARHYLANESPHDALGFEKRECSLDLQRETAYLPLSFLP